jgi:hypothetical protein
MNRKATFLFRFLEMDATVFFRLKGMGLSLRDECKSKCGRSDCSECSREIHLSIWNDKDQVDCETCQILVCIRFYPTTFHYLDPMTVN